MPEPAAIVIGARPLDATDVAAVARARAPVRLDPGVRPRVAAGRAELEAVLAGDRPVYGVSTGFGHLQDVRVDAGDLAALQRNLVRSHACGVGPPLDDEVVRAMLLLLANALAKGRSGVRPRLVEAVADLVDRGVVPVVPGYGSVGASGDLAPLAHCALVLIGEGRARGAGAEVEGAEALAAAGLEPVALEAKEGLALLNGTHLMAAVGALAVVDAGRLLAAATVAGAVAVEALLASHRPFDERLHALRRQPGQVRVAAWLRALLAGSEVVRSHADCARVQDPYSLRCLPQVLGAVADAWAHVDEVVHRELDAVTDNPLVIDGEAISGGNFHGQPLSLVLDHAALATAELAGFSERRTALLLAPGPAGLPAFLAHAPGLESGMMILQYTASALLAELAGLAHPSGLHSTPTSANLEDWNSQGAVAALGVRRAVDLAFRVVAIELLCGCEAVERHAPLAPGVGVAAAVRRVRSLVTPLEGDRPLGEDVERLAGALAGGLLDGLIESA